MEHPKRNYPSKREGDITVEQRIEQSDLEQGYHKYNALQQEFDEKDYSSDKRGAIMYSIGLLDGRHELKTCKFKMKCGGVY